MTAGPFRTADTTPPVVPRRLLVVDDDPGLRLVLARALARLGYEVVVAHNGAQALTELRNELGIVAVVSDITMPEKTGIELATHILQQHPGLPVLFVTSSAPPPSLLEHPLVGLLAKPAVLTDLRDCLDDLLERTPARPWPRVPAVELQRPPAREP